jgi:hypothetical protein
MIIDDLNKIIKEDTLPVNVADMYLKIYVAELDWTSQISQLWTNTKNKMPDEDLAKSHMKKTIACTTLLPYYDKSSIPDRPENLLFWIPTWKQFNEKDWIILYKKMVTEDIEIRKNRRSMLQYGVIEALDYVPMTRQAFNWLYSEAENSGIINDNNKKDIIKKLQNLVRIYGGAVICNIFTKHQANVSKVLNWRSGYFIEKEIYKIYSVEQMQKIKKLEMSKIDKKYIKTVIKNKENF